MFNSDRATEVGEYIYLLEVNAHCPQVKDIELTAAQRQACILKVILHLETNDI